MQVVIRSGGKIVEGAATHLLDIELKGYPSVGDVFSCDECGRYIIVVKRQTTTHACDRQDILTIEE